jgi:membrane fusion protein (multidrug efflux system)
MIDSQELRNVLVRRRVDIILGILLTLIVVVAGVIMLKYLVSTDATKARPVGLPIPVQTLPASVTSLKEVVGASGTMGESTDAFLTNRVVARVISVPVELGTIVQKGALLAEMDDSYYASAVEHARTNHDHTSAQLERMLAMQAKGYASAVEVEQARTADTAAKEALVEAQFNLSCAKMTAPAPAIILSRNINPGEIPSVGSAGFKLGIIVPIYMVAQVSEEKIGSVHLGMEGDVSTDGFPGVVFKGKVVKIDGSVNDTTRTFGVYISIPNEDVRLIPGITGYARLTNQHMGLAVPSTAVIDPVGDRATVFVVDSDNHAHARSIRRGLMADGMTEILDGLEEGEHVVTVGMQELHDKDRVLVNQSGPWNK